MEEKRRIEVFWDKVSGIYDVFGKNYNGRVIHLLDDPYKALSELDRVCKAGGKMIIPTYVNKDKAKGFDKTIDKAGADS